MLVNCDQVDLEIDKPETSQPAATKLEGSTDLSSMQLQQLNRQYDELENQFMITEHQLEERVLEIEQLENIIRALEQELLLKIRLEKTEAVHTSKSQEHGVYTTQLLNRLSSLEVIHAQYKKSLSQTSGDLEVCHERIGQLEERNQFLEKSLGNLKHLQEKYDISQKEVQRLVAMVIEMKRKYAQTITPFAAEVGGSRSLVSSDSTNRMVCNTTQNLAAAQTATNDRPCVQPMLRFDAEGICDDTPYADELMRSPVVSASSSLFTDYNATASKSRSGNEDHEPQTTRVLFSPSCHTDVLTKPTGKCFTSAAVAQKSIDTTKDKLSVASYDHDEFSQKLEVKELESHDLSTILGKQRSLLRKQDMLIRQGLKTSAKLTLREAEFIAYRKQCEENEARLREENSLIAKAFFDFSTKFFLNSANLHLAKPIREITFG